MKKQSAPLTLSKLTKSYGRHRGVSDISLSLIPGEVFGFLGPNGAGKTTAIRTILDFLRPTKGSISVFGMDSVKDSVAIKSQVGYLAGDIALYDNLNGKQLLTYLTSLGRNTDWAYVDELSSLLQADLKRPIKTLSKGNQQKIGLIQAFMHRPKLLILDEPTSGLDPLMQQVFYGMVQAAQATGSTVFLSSHNLTEVQKICNRAAFIREGKLIAVEDIAKTQQISLRRFTVWFVRVPSEDILQALPGVTQIEVQGNVARLTHSGQLSPLLRALSAHNIINLDQEETTLEEIFMHYYEGGN